MSVHKPPSASYFSPCERGSPRLITRSVPGGIGEQSGTRGCVDDACCVGLMSYFAVNWKSQLGIDRHTTCSYVTDAESHVQGLVLAGGWHPRLEHHLSGPSDSIGTATTAVSAILASCTQLCAPRCIAGCFAKSHRALPKKQQNGKRKVFLMHSATARFSHL